MKKVLLSVIVLSVLQLQARPAEISTDATLNKDNNSICQDYNLTAINSIYKSLEQEAGKIQYYENRLKYHSNPSFHCQQKFDAASNATNGSLTPQDIKQIDQECKAFVLDDQTFQKISIIVAGIKDAAKYKNVEQYSEAHSTNLRMSCDVAREKINALKQALNL